MSSRKMAIPVILSVMTVLAGCGSLEPEEAPREEYEKVTWFSDVEFWDPPAWDTAEGTMTGDITRETGVVMDIDIPREDADTRLSIKLVNDELPDVMTLKDTQTIRKLVSSGKVWRLDEFLELYDPDSHLLKTFPEDVKESLINRDGGWYAYPSHLRSPDNKILYPPCDEFYEVLDTYGNNMGIIWNTEILAKAGLSLADVKTEEQVLSAFEKVQEMNLTINGKPVILCLTDGKGSMNAYGSGSSLETIFSSFGAEFIDKDGQYYPPILQPQAKNALKFVNQLFRKKYIELQELNLDNSQVKECVYEQRVLCFIGNIPNLGLDRLEENAKDWDSSGPILSSDGSKAVMRQKQDSVTYWLSTFISKSCSSPEAVAGWLDFMTSEKGYMLIEYGYEDVDYTMNDQGVVKATEQGKRGRDNYSVTGMGAWWAFTNTDRYNSKTLPPEENSPDYVSEYIRTAFGRSESTVIFPADPLDTMEEFCAEDEDLRKADEEIEAYLNEQIFTLLMSDTDEEFEQKYEDLIAELQNRGIEGILKQKNKYLQKAYEITGKRIEKINP